MIQKDRDPGTHFTESKVNQGRVLWGLESLHVMYIKLTCDITLAGLETILKDFWHVSVDEANIS